MKAYTPETASGNTSSAVRTPQVASLKNSALMGSTPLTTFHSGMNPSGNPHVNSAPHAFNTPTQPAILSGGVGHHQNNEVRNPTNGVPHIMMKPGM
jgi:hypothetical protein